MPELRDVSTDQQDQGLAANLVIDRDTASRLGISAAAIDQGLAAGRVMLAQETRQSEQTAGFVQCLRAFMTKRAIGRENLRAGFAGIQIFLSTRWGCQTERQNRQRHPGAANQALHCPQPFKYLLKTTPRPPRTQC